MTGIFTSDRKNEYLNPAAKPGAQTEPHQVVAVYDTNNCAHVARDGLLGAGIPRATIHVIDRADPAASPPRSAESRRKAFWAAVGSLFAPAEDPSAYHLASDPNHALVILQPTGGIDLRRAIEILRASRPLYVFPTLDAAGSV
jgi:hypothetical protein